MTATNGVAASNGTGKDWSSPQQDLAATGGRCSANQTLSSHKLGSDEPQEPPDRCAAVDVIADNSTDRDAVEASASMQLTGHSFVACSESVSGHPGALAVSMPGRHHEAQGSRCDV